MPEKMRLAWFILFRLVVASVFLVSTILMYFREPASLYDATLPGLLRLIIATYVFSLLSLLVLRYTSKFGQILSYSQIIWDLLLVTILILLTGGINSPFSFLYIISIIHASVLLSRKEAIYTASLCAILFGAILDFQFYGKLDFIEFDELAGPQHGATYVLYTIFINAIAYFLAAYLTGYLAERAKKSEDALLEKEIDYEELERLNSSIVSNLDNGLLTLNNDGKIRVFNRYAAELTGLTQEDAYDRSLWEVFPCFALMEQAGQLNAKGEVEYQSSFGDNLTLEYKVVPLNDREGQRAGDIVALQDITRFKRLESQLKRADQLAVIGALAARIAHEIRNPLASISGSVQLIAQADRITPGDEKLLDIVVRETERLNDLIKNLLIYARPGQPLKIPIALKEFLADLTVLLQTDPKFLNISILCNFVDELVVEADRDQFQQVLWNLLVNAAEAMPSGGVIKVEGDVLTSVDMGIYMGDVVRISISDKGKGMSRENRGRVFEPFFTTKSGGNGLGLAIVYRIIEAHSGLIQVESRSGEGTTFTIHLPLLR